MKLFLKISTGIIAGLLLVASSAQAIEGRIEIAYPTTIVEPGSYIVVKDILAYSNAIVISASNVKVDLNGFTLSQDAGGTYSDGIVVDGSKRNIEVSNGTIKGFKRHGVSVAGLTNSTVNLKLSNLRISDNGYYGIVLDSHVGFVIEGCFVTGNLQGISASGVGLLTNNVIGDNGTGIISHGGKVGFVSNVFFNKSSNDIFGNPTNLGKNLCSGVLCP